jgi:hypothetical protein
MGALISAKGCLRFSGHVTAFASTVSALGRPRRFTGDGTQPFIGLAAHTRNEPHSNGSRVLLGVRIKGGLLGRQDGAIHKGIWIYGFG